MTQDILKSIVGSWSGTCKTWFEPNVLADESEISGTFKELLDGKFLRHAYASTIKGKPRSGEETIALNRVTKQYEIAWFDSFHMNYAIMFFTGEAAERGFQVTGKYDVGEGHPPWGWRTEYELVAEDHLTISAYNISPEGEEAKALETVYARVAE